MVYPLRTAPWRSDGVERGRKGVWESRSSLRVAIGRAALARPITGTSEPVGRGPVPGGLGWIAFTVPMS